MAIAAAAWHPSLRNKCKDPIDCLAFGGTADRFRQDLGELQAKLAL
jgi:hypothetical protein